MALNSYLFTIIVDMIQKDISPTKEEIKLNDLDIATRAEIVLSAESDILDVVQKIQEINNLKDVVNHESFRGN